VKKKNNDNNYCQAVLYGWVICKALFFYYIYNLKRKSSAVDMSDDDVWDDDMFDDRNLLEKKIREFQSRLKNLTTIVQIQEVHANIKLTIAKIKRLPGDENSKNELLGYIEMCKGYVNQRECQIQNPDSNCDNLSNFTDASSSSSDGSSDTSDGSSESGSEFMSEFSNSEDD